jgi:V/A-type H+-transporting ATPase subunit D
MANGKNNTASLKTTRLELIKTKIRMKAANRGLELLKLKRGRLVKSFFEIAKEITAIRKDMRIALQKAVESTKVAETISGRLNMEMVAEESAKMEVDLSASDVMGIRLPDVRLNKRADLGVENILSVPIPIGDARIAYRSLLDIIISVSQKEEDLRTLLREIQKINRRTNALQYSIIPKLAAKVSYIKQRLDDYEKDQIVALKFIKRKLNG